MSRIVMYNERQVAGTLLFVGGIQWFLVILIAESIHPGYNGAFYYVSSLGVGVTALLYNLSMLLLGVATAVGSYLIYRVIGSKLFLVVFTITGLATMGVALFPEGQSIHGIVTPIALLFGAFSAIVSFKLQKSPLSYAFVVLGVLSLGFGIIFNPYLGLPRESFITYLGLGKGTMERLIIYPLLLWTIAFGSHLVGSTNRG